MPLNECRGRLLSKLNAGVRTPRRALRFASYFAACLFRRDPPLPPLSPAACGELRTRFFNVFGWVFASDAFRVLVISIMWKSAGLSADSYRWALMNCRWQKTEATPVGRAISIKAGLVATVATLGSFAAEAVNTGKLEAEKLWQTAFANVCLFACKQPGLICHFSGTCVEESHSGASLQFNCVWLFS